MSLFENMNPDLLEKEAVMLRFMNNEKLWEKFAVKFLEDQTFQGLLGAMESREKTRAFEEAHTLKGVVGNLGFQQLFAACSEIVEALRSDAEWTLIDEKWAGVQREYTRVTEDIEKNRN